MQPLEHSLAVRGNPACSAAQPVQRDGDTAFAGPWGITYAMNLTPDVNTGIGIWTEDIFVRAIKEGRHWGQSRPIMPPMPWEFFRNLTDEDLRSIYAYLRTIKPVVNRVPEYQPPPSREEE